MRVIGTAGHVDHGKSTLIAALTGIHPDRLKEEREREMTIDLGFAWLELPGGEAVGFVDVPGHRDFIENMLAGVGGIDAVLLVIAADEGVMPQTREHLAIIDLLQVKTGLVVLTKIDKIADPEWLSLVEAEIRHTVQSTILQDAPILRVSSISKAGLPELIQQISQVLQNTDPRPDLSRPRLPVDRVFSMPGFGTVVTGTLLDGHFEVGEEVEIWPSGLKARLRGLQTHKKDESIAIPGSRTAANLSGVEVDQLHRGDVVALPGQYRPTRRVDVQFRLLPGVSGPLLHHSEVKLFLGASETLARVRLLGIDRLDPGETGWLQLELNSPIVAVHGDRYILRRPSPAETLGGGSIVDPFPSERHKPHDPAVVKRLELLINGSSADRLFQSSLVLGPAPVKNVISHSRLDIAEAARAAQELIDSGQWIRLDDLPLAVDSLAIVMALPAWLTTKKALLNAVSSYHDRYPLRHGIPKEELRSRLKILPPVFNGMVHKLVLEQDLKESSKWVALPQHQVHFSPFQQVKIDQLMQQFAASPLTPPSIKESRLVVGDDIFDTLLETGELVAVSPDVVFRKTDFEKMVDQLVKILQEKGQITLAETRDLFDTSRRYAQAFLEYLDSTGLTVREDDFRRLAK